MKKSVETRGWLALGACLLIQGSALADDAEAPSSHADYLQKGPPRPPAEAFAACEGKADGDSCEVTFHGEAHAGTCVAPRAEELFCLPHDMPPPPRDGYRQPQR